MPSLDPAAQALLQAMTQGAVAPDFSRLKASDYRAGLAARPLPASSEKLENIVDRNIAGPGGTLPIRIYRPSAANGLAATVFFHGGGFISCGLDTHDNLCRRLANLSGAVVIAVDYRLAPEALFPAALEDACAVLRWLRQAGAELGVDAQRIAVAGDSAGANLAAAAAAQLRDEGVSLRHQLLFYPALDPACDSASFRELGDAGFLLTTEMMRWFWAQYLPAGCERDARAAPLLLPSFAGLPPATVISAECDPLRDEGEAYARALAAAGVPARSWRVPGMFHGFASLLGFLEAADTTVAAAAQALREALAEKI